MCATGRNEDVLKELAAEIGCEYVVGDLGKEEDPPRVVKEAVECVCVGVRRLVC